jgi:hypothetical protein
MCKYQNSRTAAQWVAMAAASRNRIACCVLHAGEIEGVSAGSEAVKMAKRQRAAYVMCV